MPHQKAAGCIKADAGETIVLARLPLLFDDDRKDVGGEENAHVVVAENNDVKVNDRSVDSNVMEVEGGTMVPTKCSLIRVGVMCCLAS